MKKTLVAKLAILFLAFSTLTGCILAVDDDGYRRGGPHDRDHGDRSRDNRGDRNGDYRGDRR